MNGKNTKSSTSKSEKNYTFLVLVSFDIDYRFRENQVQPAEEDGKDVFDLTEKALAEFEYELKEYLTQSYWVNNIIMESRRKKSATSKSEERFTFLISVSFDTQYTFKENEVRPAEEGGEDDLEPTEKALAEFEYELKEYLTQEYAIDTIEAWADFDNLLGMSEIIY